MKIKLILLIFLSNVIYSQTNYFELKTIRKSEISVIEKEFKSSLLKESEKPVYSQEEKSLVQPINYIRSPIDNFPASIVRYMCSAKDSVVKSITFTWELNIDKELSQSEKVEKYNVAFNDLVKSLSVIFGKPEPSQGKLTEIESPVENDKSLNYERRVVWKTEKKTVTALIVWAESHGQQMITTIK